MRLAPLNRFKPSSKIFYLPFQGGTSFVDLLCFCSVLCLLCLCARLFICVLWSPAGKGLTSWLSSVVSAVSLSLSHWYPGSGVVLDCIDSWSLHPYLLWFYINPVKQFTGTGNPRGTLNSENVAGKCWNVRYLIPFYYFIEVKCVFSSPEPKALRWAISIPMTPSSVRPSVVRQHFQTSSPLKPLGQLNSNFIWRLLRMGEQKFVQMVLVTWPRWPPRSYMVKTL